MPESNWKHVLVLFLSGLTHMLDDVKVSSACTVHLQVINGQSCNWLSKYK